MTDVSLLLNRFCKHDDCNHITNVSRKEIDCQKYDIVLLCYKNELFVVASELLPVLRPVLIC